MSKLIHSHEIIDELMNRYKDETTSNEHLIIIGAGFNIAFAEGNMSWDELIIEMHENLGNKNFNNKILSEPRIVNFAPKVRSQLINFPTTTKSYLEFRRPKIKEGLLSIFDLIVANLKHSCVDILTTNYELPGALDNRKYVSNNEMASWSTAEIGSNFFLHGSYKDANIIMNSEHYRDFYKINYRENKNNLSLFLKKRKYKKIIILGMSGHDTDFLDLIYDACSTIDKISVDMLLTDYSIHESERLFVSKLMKLNYDINTIFLEINNFPDFVRELSKLLIHNPISTKEVESIQIDYLKKRLENENDHKKRRLLFFESKNQEIIKSDFDTMFSFYKLNIGKFYPEDIAKLDKWTKWRFSQEIIETNSYEPHEIDKYYSFIKESGNIRFIVDEYIRIKRYLNDENRWELFETSIKDGNLIIDDPLELEYVFTNKVSTDIYVRSNISISSEITIKIFDELINKIVDNDEYELDFLNYKGSSKFKILKKYIKQNISIEQAKLWLSSVSRILYWRFKAMLFFNTYVDAPINLDDFGFKHKIEYIDVLDNILPSVFTPFFLTENAIKSDNISYLMLANNCTEADINKHKDKTSDNEWLYEKLLKAYYQGIKITLYSIWSNNIGTWKIKEKAYSGKGIKIWNNETFYNWNFEELYNQFKNGIEFEEDVNIFFTYYDQIDVNYQLITEVISHLKEHNVSVDKFKENILEKATSGECASVEMIYFICKFWKEYFSNDWPDFNENRSPISAFDESSFGKVASIIAKYLSHCKKKGFAVTQTKLFEIFVECGFKDNYKVLFYSYFFYVFYESSEAKKAIEESNLINECILIIVSTTNLRETETCNWFIKQLQTKAKNRFLKVTKYHTLRSIVIIYFFAKKTINSKYLSNTSLFSTILREIPTIMKYDEKYARKQMNIISKISPTEMNIYDLLDIANADLNNLFESEIYNCIIKWINSTKRSKNREYDYDLVPWVKLTMKYTSIDKDPSIEKYILEIAVNRFASISSDELDFFNKNIKNRYFKLYHKKREK